MTEKIIDLYGGDVQVRFTEENHAYWLIKDKKPVSPMKRLTGVTSFTGSIFDKSSNLIPWALDLTGDYLVDHMDELSKKKTDLTAIFEAAKEASKTQKERSSAIGKAVHAWIEAHSKGQNPDMPDDPQVLKGVLSFIQWVEENKVEFLWTERVVYSRKFRYVGTADTGLHIKAGPLKGLKPLGDYKVSNGLYSPVRLQTAAYQAAIVEESPKVKFDGRVAIRISAETEEEYNVRMQKKWDKKGYNIPIPPYQIFEMKYFPETTFKDDFKQAMNAWSLIQWNRIAEKEMFNKR